MHDRRTTRPLWPRWVLAAALLSMGVSANPAMAESDVRPVNPAFGAKPWVAAPPANRRTAVYRSRLEAEIRRLDVHGPPRDLKTKSRLKRFRRELSRVRRSGGR